eukprot:938824_1
MNIKSKYFNSSATLNRIPHQMASSDACFVSFIYTAIVLTFAWPLYLYLLTKWYVHRNHFVIRNRWPRISLIMVAFTIIIELLFLIESAFCMSSLNQVSMGFANAIQGLVYYRAYLTHARTMKTRQFRKIMAPVVATEQHNTCQRYASQMLLYTILIASVLIITCRYLNIAPPIYLIFISTLLFGVVCLINIIRHKVKDSIGITKECVIQITITFTMMVGVPVTTSLFPSVKYEMNTCFAVLSNTLYGISTLFIAYNLLRKAKVSNDASVHDALASKSTDSAGELHDRTDLNITKQTHRTNDMSVLPPLHSRESLNRWLDKPLWVFLNGNMQNMSVFIEYLCECFALENMLFLERAIILHHLIKKYQDMDTAHAVPPVDADEKLKFDTVCARPYYKLQFMHLTPIYNDIEAIIKKGCEENEESDTMVYKRGIVSAMKLIYRQFCHRDSDTEINIAFVIQDRLCALLEGNPDGETLEQFTRYEDLLMVFHDAIDEIVILCECIYGFQFKSYLREHMVKKEPELSLALVEHDSAQIPKREKMIQTDNVTDFNIDK